MGQQCRGGRDRIAAMRTIDGAGMTILADAAGVAKSLAAADTGHHRGGQLLRHQGRPLLNVQLQVGADLRRIEQSPPLANRLRIEAAFYQSGLEAAAVVRSRYGEARRVEQPECAAAPEIRNVEPGGLLGANPHDRDITADSDSGLPQ